MFPHESFRLNRQAVLLAMISAAFPATGYGAAGRVDFASGEASVTGKDGTPRALAKGAEVNPGDTINTNQGRAQIRFTDGAFVSVQPQTTFRVDEYAYGGKPDGSEKGFFSLLKGAMRTVTGAIGKVNRQAYQVYTPSATIGIRGTGYIATVTNPTELYCWVGTCVLTNQKGSVVCDEGQTCRAANQDTKPEQTGEPGDGPRPDGLPLGFLGANQNSQSEPGPAALLAPDVLRVGVNNPASVAFADDLFNCCPDAGEGVVAGTSATLDAGLGLQGFTLTSGGTVLPGAGTSVTDVGVDPGGVGLDPRPGLLAWGRWTGGSTGGTAPSLDLTGGEGHASSLHYVVGVPTTAAEMSSLATQNVVATYTLIGGTRPTETSFFSGNYVASSAPTSGEMTAFFHAGRVSLDYLSVPNPRGSGANYELSASNVPIAGSAFSTLNGGSAFASGGSCSFSCSASVHGFFAGANAARAGVTYQIQNFSNNGTIGGAAGFARTDIPLPPPNGR